uniref:Uncharacterized protein n=1 Tax=viral metagenome TaxID=1070528 RepID=A0A6C0JMU2_9ZZZZ
MGFNDNPIGVLTTVNNTIVNDMSELDETKLPINDDTTQHLNQDINDFSGGLNAVGGLIARNSSSFTKEVKDLYKKTSANLSILNHGYLCALKGGIPDLNTDTCTVPGAAPTVPVAAPTVPEPQVSTSPPANYQVTLPSDPLPINTVGNRESFGTFENFFATYSNYYKTMPIIEGLDGIDTPAGANAMKSDIQLTKDLIAFNSNYQQYLYCNKNSIDDLKCTSPTDPGQTVNSQIQKLSTEITNKIGNSNNKTGIIGNINKVTLLPNGRYEPNYTTIKNTQNDNLKMRSDLDMKLMELYNPEKSVLADYKTNFDSTIYSGILISALATSILFYVFTEI